MKNVVESTSIVTLYKAVITAAELSRYFEKHGMQFGLNEVDSKSIADFLWEARAQERAGNSLVWMSSSLQLGWPVSELAEALGIDPTYSCSYNRYNWLVPKLTETLLPPSSYGRKPLMAQPGLFRKIEDATEKGSASSTPTWLAFLAIWLQAMTGMHPKQEAHFQWNEAQDG